jgi:GT2 family glycosyltransferase
MSDVVAIVLNWNNYEDTRECVISLLGSEYDNLEIIIVDNGSTDSSGDELNEEFPSVTVCYNSTNRGFGGGMNTGIDFVMDNHDAEYIWLLNSDTRVNAKTISELVSDMEDRREIGILTPRIMSQEDVWFEHGTVNWNIGVSKQKTAPSEEKYVRNDYIPLCASLVRREVFERGLRIPVEYFLYFEDVDFCLQVSDSGYSLVTNTSVTIQHAGGGSTGGGFEPIPSYYTARNRFILFTKKYSDRCSVLCSPYNHLRNMGRLTIQLSGGNFAGVRATIQGWIDGLQGVSGKGPYP